MHVPISWTKTFLTFIPKIKNPTDVTHYRQIALSNVNYRIFARVISNQLKPLLSNIISYNQSIFLPNRSIHSNILIAQEAAHTMFSSGGKNPLVLVKLDLKKGI